MTLRPQAIFLLIDEALEKRDFGLASRLLRQHDLVRSPNGRLIAERLSRFYLDSAKVAIRQRDFAKAWLHTQDASLLSPDAALVHKERAKLVELTLSHARKSLKRAKIEEAELLLKHFKRFHVLDERVRQIENALSHVRAAESFVLAGRFGDAVRHFDSAMTLMPELKSIRRHRDSIQRLRRTSRRLDREIQLAMQQQQWLEARDRARELLAFSPHNEMAKSALESCNRKLGHPASATQQHQQPLPQANSLLLNPTEKTIPGTENGSVILAESVPSGITTTDSQGNSNSNHDSTNEEHDGRQEDASPEFEDSAPSHWTDSNLATSAASLSRFMLWIDGVGGFLVCPESSVLVGLAVPDSGVQIPIQADISRRHAKLLHCGEDYMLEPLGKVSIDGKPVKDKTPLPEKCLIELGVGTQMLFHQPHALCRSARLEMLTRHRIHPWVDGVLLMADALVLGHHRSDHLVCPEWDVEITLFRRGDRLFCRGSEPLEVNGEVQDDECELNPNDRVICGNAVIGLEKLPALSR